MSCTFMVHWHIVIYLPIGKLFLTIRCWPLVYSISTVIGAEYVISLKRH